MNIKLYDLKDQHQHRSVAASRRPTSICEMGKKLARCLSMQINVLHYIL